MFHSTALSNIIYDENIKKNEHIIKKKPVNSHCSNDKNHVVKRNYYLHRKELSNKNETVELNTNTYANHHEHLITVRFSDHLYVLFLPLTLTFLKGK
jgi:hypothetical protein